MTPFSDSFYARSALHVAPELLGHLLVYAPEDGPRRVGRIVETEAYTEDDPAFHGWNARDPETGELQRTSRTADLFGPPGRSYVYLIYGMYWLLNVVTEPDGIGGGVLIRAVEPVEGIDAMRPHRPAARRDVDLTNGPGKLTQAFGIDDEAYHNVPLTAPPLYFAQAADAPAPEIVESPRIGISKGTERPWRFSIEGNPYVSVKP